jgi:PAS domain-containing protein
MKAANDCQRATPMTLTARKFVSSWIVPVATVGAALLSRRLFSSGRDNTPIFLFLAAVAISTWYGGWTSGLFATLLAGFATARLLLPTYASAPGGGSNAVRWLLFMLTAPIITFGQVAQGCLKQKLWAKEQRLSLALDSSGCGIWEYNLVTRQFWWSKKIETIYRSSEGNFPRTYDEFFETIHSEDRPLFNRVITRTIDEGSDYEIEHRIVLPDKSIRRVNVRGRIFYNDASRAERIVGLTADITDRKQLHVGNLHDSDPKYAKQSNPIDRTAAASVELGELPAKSAH